MEQITQQVQQRTVMLRNRLCFNDACFFIVLCFFFVFMKEISLTETLGMLIILPNNHVRQYCYNL